MSTERKSHSCNICDVAILADLFTVSLLSLLHFDRTGDAS